MPRAEDTGGLFRLAMASQQTNSEPSRSLQGLSNSDQATLVAGEPALTGKRSSKRPGPVPQQASTLPAFGFSSRFLVRIRALTIMTPARACPLGTSIACRRRSKPMAAAGEMASGARRQPMFTKIIPWRAKQIQTFAWFQIVRLFAPPTKTPPGASLPNGRPDVACLSISDMNRWVTLVFNKFASSRFLHWRGKGLPTRVPKLGSDASGSAT